MNILFLLRTDVFVPCAYARGRVIGFVRLHHLSVVCCLSSAQKSPDLGISASKRVVTTTKPLKAAKNLLEFALNRTVQLTSTTNRVFLLTTSINHTYKCAQLVRYRQVKVVNDSRHHQSQACCMCSRQLQFCQYSM